MGTKKPTKPKMTRAEGLNPPEDPEIVETIEMGTGLEPEEVSPGKPEESPETAVALASAYDGSPTSLRKQIEATDTKIALLGEFIKKHLKAGVDYGQIAFHASNCAYKGQPTMGPTCKEPFCKMSKPFLHKPGSEKFVILFSHRAKFFWIKQDFETGIFATRCVLVNKNNEPVGEGYGSARTSEKAKWTENEAMKIACKRAQIDASLRAYGLSEHFTQDLDDINSRKDTPVAQNTPKLPPNGDNRVNVPNKTTTPAMGQFTPRNPSAPMSDPQRSKIFLLVNKLGHDKDWIEKFIFDKTGIQGVENISMGYASKLIDALQKKYESIQSEGLETINYDEPPEESMKIESDVSQTVEPEADPWNGF